MVSQQVSLAWIATILCVLLVSYMKHNNIKYENWNTLPSVFKGGGSGPYFSKFITTPPWSFCTSDSKHCINILCEITAYERPKINI